LRDRERGTSVEVVPLPAIHVGLSLAITRRLSLGARDREARRHYWKRHKLWS
jgi:hypothetical protein